MALKHAILAALAFREASGYDLAKAFDVTVANFWAATPQQLYRELDRLTDEGLVVARTVEQEKRPNKRMLSLTDAGRATLRDFTTIAPKPTAVRDELLVQVEALGFGDPADIRRHVEVKLAASGDKLARYLQSRERLLDGRSESDFLAGSRKVGPYLTLARGIAFEEENIRWCHLVLATLDARDPQR